MQKFCFDVKSAKKTIVFIILIKFKSVCLDNSVISAIDQRGDRLNFTEIAALLGHPVKEYEVVTEDGYILGVYRIPGGLRPPILFVHGIELAADSWLLRGQSSLPIVLAKLNHDIWFANVRGNIYSRRHVRLNPDTDSEFWEFTFHEHGYYDLASTIDTVLNETNSSQINAISFSQGTTMFTVLLSTRPEYNAKINLSIYFAPIAYLNKVETPMLYGITFSPELNIVMKKLGMNELLGYNDNLTVSLRKLCTQPQLSYVACAYGYAFPIAGYDPDQLEPPFYRISNYYFPVGSSRKNMIHYGQIGRTGIFAQYDYGPLKNIAVYNSSIPPKYNLSNVRSPVVMMVGRRDKLATLSDAETLRKQLPNVKQFVVLPRIEANHLDFIWGRTMNKYLYPYIFNALGF